MIPMGLFLATTLADHDAKDAWAFSLIFGLPIVFFAGLLGAYVVQIRNPDEDVSSQNSQEGVDSSDKEQG